MGKLALNEIKPLRRMVDGGVPIGQHQRFLDVGVVAAGFQVVPLRSGYFLPNRHNSADISRHRNFSQFGQRTERERLEDVFAGQPCGSIHRITGQPQVNGNAELVAAAGKVAGRCLSVAVADHGCVADSLTVELVSKCLNISRPRARLVGRYIFAGKLPDNREIQVFRSGALCIGFREALEYHD